MRSCARPWLHHTLGIAVLALVGADASSAASSVGREYLEVAPASVSPVDFATIGRFDASGAPAVCGPGEEESVFFASARVFGSPVELRGARVTRCEPVSGTPSYEIGANFSYLSTGFQLGGCTVSSIFDAFAVDDHVVAAVGCADTSARIAEWTWNGQAGGVWTEAVSTGDVLSNGRTIDDFKIRLDAFSDAGLLRITFGYRDDLGQTGIGLAEESTSYTLSSIIDSAALGASARAPAIELDCPAGTRPGDANCTSPIGFGINYWTSATEFGALTALRDLAGPVVSVGDAAFGLPAETWSILSNNVDRYHSTGSRTGLVHATGSGGTTSVLRLDNGTIASTVISSGDRKPDLIRTFSGVETTTTDSGDSMFLADGDVLALVDDELRTIARVGVDVMGGQTIFSPAIGSRGLADGMAAVVLDNRLAVIPHESITRIDRLEAAASAVYGSDAVAGVVNLITKENFEGFEISAPGGVTLGGTSFNSDGDVEFGTTNGEIQIFDRDLQTFSSRDTTLGVNLGAYERDGAGDIWASNGVILYGIDATTFVGSQVAAITELDGGGNVFDLTGLGFNPDDDELYGLQIDCGFGPIDRLTGVLDARYRLDGVPPGIGCTGIGFDLDSLFYVSLADGRLVVGTLDDASGQAPAQLDVPFGVVGQATTSLNGIAVMVPEPGGAVGAAAALAALAGLRVRRLSVVPCLPADGRAVRPT